MAKRPREYRRSIGRLRDREPEPPSRRRTRGPAQPESRVRLVTVDGVRADSDQQPGEGGSEGKDTTHVDPILGRVGAGKQGNDRPEVGRPRRRREPLRVSGVRAAEHSDLAVGPRLLGRPLDRVESVCSLTDKGLERALRSVAPAHVLDHDDVAATDRSQHIQLAGEVDRVGLVVRRPGQQHRVSARRRRAVDVGAENGAVPSRRCDISFCDERRVPRLLLVHTRTAIPSGGSITASPWPVASTTPPFQRSR